MTIKERLEKRRDENYLWTYEINYKDGFNELMPIVIELSEALEFYERRVGFECQNGTIYDYQKIMKKALESLEKYLTAK